MVQRCRSVPVPTRAALRWQLVLIRDAPTSKASAAMAQSLKASACGSGAARQRHASVTFRRSDRFALNLFGDTRPSALR